VPVAGSRRELRPAGGVTARESPQETARRLREEAERRARRSGSRGRVGPGRRTTAALAALPPAWSLVRGLPGPADPDSETLAAVGPAGIVVVGWTGGAPQDGSTGRPTARAESLLRSAELVRGLCGPHRQAVRAVLCVADDADDELPGSPGPPPPPVSEVPAVPGVPGVAVCRPGDLVRTLIEAPVVLTGREVAEAALRLEGRLRGTGSGPAGRPPPTPPAGAHSRPGARVRQVATVLAALVLLVGLLLAAPRIGDRLDTGPGPARDPDVSGSTGP
jgi:hypothetical protein